MKEKFLKSKSSSYEVISLSLKNLSACLKLDEIALKGLWSKKQWEKELADSKRLCLGILDFTNLIAFGCGWVIVDELHLTAIAVHPKYRQKGLGRIVLTHLFQEAIHRGCNRSTLEVRSNNNAALALYKSCGFKTEGYRQSYYKNGTDALIQWRSLNP
ncbi:ribosomal protein S18-alanine N-acetyltransferase [Prochlorococcus sp. MIT 1307]|uniref:ribosomal protein S18-alanine N-acetyltransferase n=1 Tax=Prochlorococcus sp. MIT 1307 TaxID=3096219 RepID=UPI002A7638A3|nr:ribosomal protein S18-alanine N-acetyltransferase [Prochlorococcus sp. MIT 1307]